MIMSASHKKSLLSCGGDGQSTTDHETNEAARQQRHRRLAMWMRLIHAFGDNHIRVGQSVAVVVLSVNLCPPTGMRTRIYNGVTFPVQRLSSFMITAAEIYAEVNGSQPTSARF